MPYKITLKIYNSIKWVYSDLRNLRSLENIFKENEFDGVFHLAAQSHPPTSFIDPIGTMETNVMGSANLIQCISDHQPKCNLMFCSTSEVYGNTGRDGRKLERSEGKSSASRRLLTNRLCRRRLHFRLLLCERCPS